MILENNAQFGENVLAPLNETGDFEGLKYDSTSGKVTTPKGFKDAWKEYVAGGWQGLSVPEAYGGQGLPLSLGVVRQEILAESNWSWTMYPGLSIGAMNTLILYGSEDQKQTYLTRLASGDWSGTMCLTEPHCGTDLGQCKTRAEPHGDGSFRLNGTKIFISCCQHNFL